ncbi:glycosyltransferase [Bacillus halotolerans]|uniref:glycosyltransferase family 2 protein n=1 Tax=Bacillus halotolerans TaxID=260554 RepID=UPI000D01EDCA|nr:glycosyltransferase family 2 protein [Bacillus halotolerans]PRP52880.1 glycosyltransferase [Bacillus halotolerans]PRP58102.1 glycosyltransferase [Bacillus halotolerans]PRP62306.1 glycosyltransferase [Bacillus halotolerans]
MKRPKLSVCMIVKNEERHIVRCLESVQHIADEIIVVDTGSNDQTVEICRSFHAQVYHHQWTQDYSQARNISLQHAKGEWILILDADEELDVDTGSLLRSLLNDCRQSLGYVNVINYTGKQWDENEAFEQMQIRLIRNQRKITFKGRICEKPVGEEARGAFSLPCVIHHYGYLEQEAKCKHKRNLSILNTELLTSYDDPLLIYQKAAEYDRGGEQSKAIRLAMKCINECNSKKQMPPAVLYYIKFKLFIDFERYEEAERDIDEALRHYPDYSTLYYYKGIMKYQLKKVREAIAAFESCLQTQGEHHQYVQVKGAADFRSLCWLGVCHAELPQHMTAVLYLQKALKANPRCTQAQQLLSELTKDQAAHA